MKFTNLVINPHIATISSGAFNGCTSVTGVTIEESDETLSLGYNASIGGGGRGLFYDCPLYSVFIGRPLSYSASSQEGYSPFAQSTTLVKAHLGNPLQLIQNYLFYNCTALKTMVYNSQCKPTAVGEYTFSGCKSLTWDALALPESVKSIRAYAFRNCVKFTDLVIKPHITSIDNYSFNGCTSVTSVSIEEGEETLKLGYKSSSNNGQGLFYDCPLQSVFIGRPLSYSGSGYGYSPFAQSTTLVKAHLGNPVKGIWNYLFYNCTALKTMVYNSQCKPTAVGNYTFSGCKSLTWDALSLPESVKSIGQYAFQNCVKFTDLVIKPHITSIDNYAFNGCTSVTGVTIEESDETLSLGYNSSSKGLFYDCPLQSVFIGRPLSYSTNSGYSPFALSTTLVKAKLGNATRLYNYLFYGCTALTTMEYDSQFKGTGLGNYAFYGCKSIVDGDGFIPASVTSVGERAFSGCSKLESITIPSKVTSIGQYGFADCTSLSSVTSQASTPPTIKDNCFSSETYENAILNVKNTTAYSQAVGWKKFLNIVMNGNAKGDVNGDGIVDITDVVLTVNYILDNSQTNFDKTTADMNNDGDIDISDLVMIVNLILGSSE